MSMLPYEVGVTALSAAKVLTARLFTSEVLLLQLQLSRCTSLH